MKSEPRISASEVHKLARKATPHVLMAVPTHPEQANEVFMFARQLRERGHSVGLVTEPGEESLEAEKQLRGLVRMGCTRHEMREGAWEFKDDGDGIERKVPFPFLRNQINRLVVKKNGKRIEHVFYTPIKMVSAAGEDLAAPGAPARGTILRLRAQGPRKSVPSAYNSAFGDGANVLAAADDVYIVDSKVKEMVTVSKTVKGSPGDRLLEVGRGGKLRFHSAAQRRFGVPKSEFIEMPEHTKVICVERRGPRGRIVSTTDLDMCMMPLRDSGEPVFLRDESLAEKHPEAIRGLDEKMKGLGYKVVVVPREEELFCPSCGLEVGGEFFMNPMAKRTLQRLKDAGVRAVAAASPFREHFNSAAGYHCVTH